MERARAISRGGRGASSSRRRGGSTPTPAHPQAHPESHAVVAAGPDSLPRVTSPVSASQRGRSRTFQPPAASRPEASPSRPPQSNKAPKPTQLSHSFTFPSASAAMSSAAASAGARPDAAVDDSVSKGGHALRKRKVKSYTNFEIDDGYDHAAAWDKQAFHTSSRHRKRKGPSWSDDDDDEVAGASSKRPRVSRPQAEAAPSAAARRKQASRKTTADVQPSEEENSDEIDVKDTIEVGYDYVPSSAESEDQVTFDQSESSSSPSPDLPPRNSPHESPMTEKSPKRQETPPGMVESPRQATNSPVFREGFPQSALVMSPEETIPTPSQTVVDDSQAQAAVADPQAPASEPDAIGGDSRPTDDAAEQDVTAPANISGGDLEATNGEILADEPKTAVPKGVPAIHEVITISDDSSSPEESDIDDLDEVVPHSQVTHSQVTQEPQAEASEAGVAALHDDETLLPSANTANSPLIEEVYELQESPDPQGPEHRGVEVGKADPKATALSEEKLQQTESHKPELQGPEVLEADPPNSETEQESRVPEPDRAEPRESEPQDPQPQEELETQQPEPRQPEPQEPEPDKLHSSEKAEEAEPPAPPPQRPEPSTRGGRRGRAGRARGRTRATLSRAVRDLSVASGRSALDVSWRNASRSVEPTPSAAAETRNNKPWEDFAPYAEGYVFYPEAPQEAAAATPGAEHDDGVEDQPEANAPEAEANDREDGTATGEGRKRREAADAVQDTMGGSAVPTPALTPAASPYAEDTAADSPLPDVVPDEDIPPLALSSKQYRYRKLQDPQAIIAALKNHKALSTEDLYALLAAANMAAQAWQAEYKELRKITDDDDNAVRRRKDDIALEAKTAAALKKNNPETDVLEKDFIIKGVRAREEVLDTSKEYQKQQDKLMSQVYFFEYDPRDSMIGRQDPEAQREGLQGTRLRNRPKPTQKAAEAEAEENVVTGKRTRRKRALSEEPSREPSRAPTPALQQQLARRGRRGGLKNAEAAQQDADASLDHAFLHPLNGTAPKKQPVRRARGAKSLLSEAMTPMVAEEEPIPEQRTAPTRKRNRGQAMGEQSQAAGFDGPGYGYGEPAAEVLAPAPKRPRITLINHNHPGSSQHQEIPSSSFYSGARSPSEDSRPSTSSSNATAETADSSYSLRPKRARNYKDDDDPYSQSSKRQRTGAAPAPAPVLPGQIPLLPAPAGTASQQQPKQHRSLKIKPYMPVPQANPPLVLVVPNSYPRSGSSSRVGTPTPHTQQSTENGDDEEKDYRQMTKSEKMSHSMKTRWASGSMAAAVAKRKATLAAKKAAAAQAVASGVDPATLDQSVATASSSKEATPVSAGGAGEQFAEAPAEAI